MGKGTEVAMRNLYCNDPYTKGMTEGAAWIWSMAVSMPDQMGGNIWGKVRDEWKSPGSVVMSPLYDKVRHALHELKSEDLQLNLRPDLLPFFCVSRHDWQKCEQKQKDSQLKLEFDKKCRVE
jgi:hypothetical protein